MKARLLAVAIRRETDIILARQRSRKVAALLGFDSQDQTRITTAVSEIVRNALEYGGGGMLEFHLEEQGAGQSLEILISDRGAGIANLEAVLAGTHRSVTGMGIGITGARRLMDRCEIQSAPGSGTTVRLGKNLPGPARRLASTELAKIAAALTAAGQPRPGGGNRAPEPGISAAAGGGAPRPGATGGDEPGAAGYQSRRRRPLCRARRPRRPSAPGRRAEVALPLQYEP